MWVKACLPSNVQKMYQFSRWLKKDNITEKREYIYIYISFRHKLKMSTEKKGHAYYLLTVFQNLERKKNKHRCFRTDCYLGSCTVRAAMSLAPQNWAGGAPIITAYCTFHGKLAKSLEMPWRTQVKSATWGLLMSWLYHESQAMTAI